MTVRFAFCPWRFARDATNEERAQQKAFHEKLVATGRFTLADGAYVSPLAGVEVDRLALGAGTVIGGFAYLSHDVVLGAGCSVNPYAVVRGRVRAGNDVRIASHASIVAMNHNHDDLARPMGDQGESSRGVFIGDDVWIGANAVVVDGVSIGSHAIVAAGAVVTRDVPDWHIVAGNPARTVRDRRNARGAAPDEAVPAPEVDAPPASPPAAPAEATGAARRSPAPSLASALASFGERVSGQWPAIVARCRQDRGGVSAYLDRPGAQFSGLRPTCDAIEIAAMFGGLPPSFERDELVARLQSAQDPGSGMPFDPDLPPAAGYRWETMGDVRAAYLILSVGYALDVLCASFRAPLAAVHAMAPARIASLLDALPWADRAWSAGGWVDGFGTALAINRRAFALDEPVEALFDCLDRRCVPHTGLWGAPRESDGWLQPVNGFYRLVRGTYAQFGRRVPHPEAAVDTVLAHVRQYGDFAERGVNACNLLDTVHPLWYLGRLTAHRRDEGLAFIERQLPRILERWVDGRGFGFSAGDAPGLQGTEMWLAIVAIGAEALGLSSSLGYAPRGVHRLDPAACFAR